jgi:hypothetical protein
LDNDPEISQHVVSQNVSTKRLPPFYECNDVSLQVPARKKMKVELVRDEGNGERSYITLNNQATSEVEYALAASDVDQVFCLPMPDKQARQMNFVLFPQSAVLERSGAVAEPILFVMNDAVHSGVVAPASLLAEGDTFITITQRALDTWLSGYGKRVVTPSAAEFASSIPQSHRKGEKAYHVRAHRGSKEGEKKVITSIQRSRLTLHSRLPLLPRKRHSLRL